MSAESLHSWSQVAIIVGIAISFLGTIGTYYFGKKSQNEQSQVFQTSLDDLEKKIEPFQELAQATRPDLDQDAALDSLHQEIERLRKIAARHEFAPLAPELREAFVRHIQKSAPSFLNAGISIRITHETWSPPATKQYAGQLATLLREGGLQVQGPDQITYFLVTPASPIEWGYNEADIPSAEVLYKALLTVIRPNLKWTKASHQKPGSIRIHFGGEVVFEPNGIVSVL